MHPVKHQRLRWRCIDAMLNLLMTSRRKHAGFEARWSVPQCVPRTSTIAGQCQSVQIKQVRDIRFVNTLYRVYGCQMLSIDFGSLYKQNEMWSLHCFVTEKVDCKLAEHLPNTPEAIQHQPDCEMFIVTNAGDDTSTNLPTQSEWIVLNVHHTTYYALMTRSPRQTWSLRLLQLASLLRVTSRL